LFVSRRDSAGKLLPQEAMNEASEHLYSLKPALYEEQIDLFLEYQNNNYSVNSRFPPSMYIITTEISILAP
jgi:hypothetical protein